MLTFDKSEGNAPVFTELVVYKITSSSGENFTHRFMIDGHEVFSFKIFVKVDDLNKIRTIIYYNSNNPRDADHNQEIKQWYSIGNHLPIETFRYSFLNIEIVYFIPDFKNYSESVNNRAQDFSTMFARVRVIHTFKRKSSRSSEDIGAIFYTGKIKIVEPVLNTS